MAKACCHNCVYACWDMCQVMQGFSSGWPSRPMCANQPDASGFMRPTPIGSICRNYRARPATPEGDVKRIPLRGGAYAYVDAADYEWLSKYNWHVYAGGYAARQDKGKTVLMHREIMQPPKGMVVDHIDGGRGNNCRFNLRVCTPAENRRNHAKRVGAFSRFKGVGYSKDSDKYYAGLRHNGEFFWLGLFDEEVEAARAYDHKAVECCGPFARVNLPEEWPPERIQQVYADAEARLRREGEKVGRKEGKNRRAGRGRGKTKVRGKEGKRQEERGRNTFPPSRLCGSV
jgi:hypothetical protein